MAFFKQVDSFAQALDASENTDSIVKVASENGVSRNDLIVHHNLTQGNVFTGENLIKVAEDEAESPLLVAVAAYEKLASGEIGEDDAYGMITQAGLDEDDFNTVADLIDKQASEAGVVATEDVWEKIAEAHDFLTAADIDPVVALEFASEYTAAPDEETQDKVASSFDGLDEESIDKIAEAFEYLSDIEGANTVDLMAEYAKEAGAKEKALGLVGKAGDAAKRLGRDISGANVAAAKKGMKPKSFRLYSKKKATKTLEDAKKRRNISRAAVAGTAAAGLGGAALAKQASESVTADQEVWDKVAEAHEFLSEAGLDPVTSMDFAESFTAAPDEEAQDKVASSFDGLDEESIDKIAEAFEYLSDIEGAPVSELMAALDKEAGAKEKALELAGKAKDAVSRFGKDISGANVAAAKKGMKPKSFRLYSKKKATKTLEDAKKRQRNARLAAGAGALGAGALGAAAYNRRG